MIFLIKIVILSIRIFSVDSMDTYESLEANNKINERYASGFLSQYPPEKAFQILDAKCNVCHRRKNKNRIFTKVNMNTWANDIYEQVYVKKRMPKGNKIKLSSLENQELLSWISSIKND